MSKIYLSEEKKKFEIIIKVKDKSRMQILFSDLSNTNRVFISNYILEDLNVKFMKIIQFKTIEEFEKILYDNIQYEKLVLKSPYKNAITSIWKIFPLLKEKKQTFTLISSLDFNKNISLIFYSDFINSSKIVKEIENSINPRKPSKDDQISYLKLFYEDNWLIENMYFMNNKYEKVEDKKKDFLKLFKIALDLKENQEGKKLLLIFFEEEDLLDNIIEILEEIYVHQPFIIFFSNKEPNVFRYEIKKKIFDELDDDVLPYFDMDNIFVIKNNEEEYKKTILPIVKVFRYFNQLGDSFFKQLPNLINMENIEKEIMHLSFTHYFNILLCGRTGTGKSTFINKIMGEKKSFTLKYQSAGTYRNNYYIHKKYPIKIIDVCGFAEGSEGKDTQKKLNAIFNQDTNDIIIDEPMNDVFTFYGDKRNNI